MVNIETEELLKKFSDCWKIKKEIFKDKELMETLLVKQYGEIVFHKTKYCTGDEHDKLDLTTMRSTFPNIMKLVNNKFILSRKDNVSFDDYAKIEVSYEFKGIQVKKSLKVDISDEIVSYIDALRESDTVGELVSCEYDECVLKFKVAFDSGNIDFYKVMYITIKDVLYIVPFGKASIETDNTNAEHRYVCYYIPYTGQSKVVFKTSRWEEKCDQLLSKIIYF